MTTFISSRAPELALSNATPIVLSEIRMHFPVDIRFKLLAIASQIFVRDANGTLLAYVRQKLLKLREDVVVFGDAEQKNPLYRIRADRIIDIGARYTITDSGAHDAVIGSVRQRGLRTFWRAAYEIERGGHPMFTVREESVWVRALDHVFGQLPVVGVLAGYVFHAAYRITSVATGQDVLRMVKQPALFEGVFRLDSLQPTSSDDERLLLLSCMMILLLERQRS
jgi:uncharacterized protein YxjI